MASRKKLVLDGPFTESKEQLVGFIVIEAKDLDEAVEIGSNIPLARTGTVLDFVIAYVVDAKSLVRRGLVLAAGAGLQD